MMYYVKHNLQTTSSKNTSQYSLQTIVPCCHVNKPTHSAGCLALRYALTW